MIMPAVWHRKNLRAANQSRCLRRAWDKSVRNSWNVYKKWTCFHWAAQSMLPLCKAPIYLSMSKCILIERGNIIQHPKLKKLKILKLWIQLKILFSLIHISAGAARKCCSFGLPMLLMLSIIHFFIILMRLYTARFLCSQTCALY